MNRKQPVTVRLPLDIMRRLRAVTVEANNPYAPTLTNVLERGVELALRELERKIESHKK